MRLDCRTPVRVRLQPMPGRRLGVKSVLDGAWKNRPPQPGPCNCWQDPLRTLAMRSVRRCSDAH